MSRVLSDSTFNCRGKIAPFEVQELAESIARSGLQQPIVIRQIPDSHIDFGKYDYMIVTGHRRYQAFKNLKRQEIPAIIRETDEREAKILNLEENIHRKDLNILQEANGIKSFLDEKLTYAVIAKMFKVSQGWVQVRANLLMLHEDIQHEAAAGFLTQQQIKDLYSLDSYKQQIEEVKRIKDSRMRHEKNVKVKKNEDKKQDPTRKRERGREEIFKMQEFIIDILGGNFGTRCLAWASGEISTNSIYRDIKDLAKAEGIEFIPPIKDITA